MAGSGALRRGETGVDCYVKVGLGIACFGRYGETSDGEVGLDRQGWDWFGKLWFGRHGWACYGLAG